VNRGTKSKADSSLSDSIYRNGCSQELSSDKNGKVLNNSRVDNEANIQATALSELLKDGFLPSQLPSWHLVSLYWHYVHLYSV
jgi:hypothetical protein